MLQSAGVRSRSLAHATTGARRGCGSCRSCLLRGRMPGGIAHRGRLRRQDAAARLCRWRHTDPQQNKFSPPVTPCHTFSESVTGAFIACDVALGPEPRAWRVCDALVVLFKGLGELRQAVSTQPAPAPSPAPGGAAVVAAAAAPGTLDDRAALLDYFSFTMLTCPFAHAQIEFDDLTNTALDIEWTYSIYAGWKYDTEDDGMDEIGDTLAYNGKKYDILVGDHVSSRTDGSYPHSSHPGRNLDMVPAGVAPGSVVTFDPANNWLTRWDSPSGNLSTGSLELNYIVSDMSGETIRISEQNGVGYDRIPSFRSAGTLWWNYVPEAVN